MPISKFKILNSGQGGLSLLEMIIYITISGGVVLVLVALLTALTRSWSVSNSRAEVRQNVSVISTKIADRVRAASAISGTYPADALDLTIGGVNTRFNMTNNALRMITPPCTSNDWTCLSIDGSNDVGQFTSIAFDRDNNAWVSYYDVSASALKVAQYVVSSGNCPSSTAWNCTTVDNNIGGTTDTGQYTSIVFDSSGNPWVSYYDSTAANLALKVASKGGTTGGSTCTDTAWNCTTVDNTGTNTGSYASIIFDSSSNPWVSYYDTTNSSLKVASKGGITGGSTCTDTAWNCTTVDNNIGGTTDTGQYTSIVFDSSGNPWVSYYDSTAANLALKVASKGGTTGGSTCTDTAWNCTTVDNTGTNTGQYTSIAFNSSGYPWVSFYDITNTSLRVATRGGGFGAACTDTSWTCGVVDNDTDDTGQFSSLSISTSGTVLVSYYDATNLRIKVAQYVVSGGTGCAGLTTWSCAVIDDPSNSVGQYVAMKFDALGSAWISYYDNSAGGAGDLKIANNGQPITSSNVILSKCSGDSNYFTKISNPTPAKDSVRFCFKVSYDSQGQPTQDFSQEIRSTVSLR